MQSMPITDVIAALAKAVEAHRKIVEACKAFSSSPFDPDGLWTDAEKLALNSLRAELAAAKEPTP